jgi:hypothetical protein
MASTLRPSPASFQRRSAVVVSCTHTLSHPSSLLGVGGRTHAHHTKHQIMFTSTLLLRTCPCRHPPCSCVGCCVAPPSASQQRLLTDSRESIQVHVLVWSWACVCVWVSPVCLEIHLVVNSRHSRCFTNFVTAAIGTPYTSLLLHDTQSRLHFEALNDNATSAICATLLSLTSLMLRTSFSRHLAPPISVFPRRLSRVPSCALVSQAPTSRPWETFSEPLLEPAR